MMIGGIAITAGVVGMLLDPYSAQRMVSIVACVALGTITVTVLALLGVERGIAARPAEPEQSLRAGLAEVWAEPHTGSSRNSSFSPWSPSSCRT